MPLWEREFILAARVAGKNAARISVEHILPNVMNLLIVQATIQFSLGILAEAALSYVGLGAQPPTPSWGRMLADAQTLCQHRAAHGADPRLCDYHHRVGAEPDGRRAARSPESPPSGGPHMSLLEITGLSLAIDGTPILQDVSLTIKRGRSWPSPAKAGRANR